MQQETQVHLAAGGEQAKSVLRLSSAQRFVLREMTNNASIIHLQHHYDRTRHALQDKGLIRFNDTRGMYEVTDAGRAALGNAA